MKSEKIGRLAAAGAGVEGQRLSDRFVWIEWHEVVDARQFETWEA